MPFLLCIFLLFFCGCDQQAQESQYKEISSQAPQAVIPSVPAVSPQPPDMAAGVDFHAGLDMSAMGAVIEAPITQNILSWSAPAGWIQEPGRHMRMASFHPSADPSAIDCYIVALAGPAGGLEANLERWLGQLGLPAAEGTVNQLIVSAQTVNTRDGLEVKVFDFSFLQAGASPTDKTMIAAMISLDKTTIFIKMTGAISSVKENKDNYFKLLGSIARK